MDAPGSRIGPRPGGLGRCGRLCRGVPGMAACWVRPAGWSRADAHLPPGDPDRGHWWHPDRPGQGSRRPPFAPRPAIGSAVRDG